MNYTSIARNVGLAMLVIVGMSMVLASFFNLPVELAMVGLVGVGLTAYLIIHFPEWFLVAAMFAPQWKTMPVLDRLNSVVDLTIVMLACLALGLAWQIFTRRTRTRVPGLGQSLSGQWSTILAYLVFVAILTLSYLYTNAPYYGASKLTRVLVIGTIYLIAPLFLIVTEADFRHFARIFAVFSGLTAIQLIVNLEFKNADFTQNGDITRIGAGWLLSMGALLVFFYPLWTSRLARAASNYVLMPLLVIGLVASAARGPIVALLVAGLLGMCVALLQGRVRASSAALLVFFIFAGGVIAYYVLRQADIDKYTAKATELEELAVNGQSSGSAGKRLGFYRTTLEAIPDHLLFGTGIGSWATFYYGSDQRNYPHNVFLEITFEEGLLGVAAYLALLFIVARMSARMVAASNYHFLALGLLILFCVLASQFSGDLDDNRLLWVWIGMSLAAGRIVRMHQLAWRFAREQARRSRGTVPPTVVAAPPLRPSFSRQHMHSRSNDRWREKFV